MTASTHITQILSAILVALSSYNVQVGALTFSSYREKYDHSLTELLAEISHTGISNVPKKSYLRETLSRSCWWRAWYLSLILTMRIPAASYRSVPALSL